MTRKNTLIGLLMVCFLQGAVLAGEYLGAVYPHWTGTEIRLKTVPVDPRSLFRGNYARLNYDISRLSRELYEEDVALRPSELMYVKLVKGSDGVYSAESVSRERPADGLFIKGRLKYQHWSANTGDLRLRYGIEAFFAEKRQALALEKKMRGGGIAIVMLAANGKAALKDVVAD